VAKHAEKEIDLKEEIEKAKLIRRMKLEEEERERLEREKRKKRSRSRSRGKNSRRSDSKLALFTPVFVAVVRREVLMK